MATSTKLIELLAKELKTDPEIAQKTLQDWVNSVQSQLQQGQPFLVQGLGSFQMKEGKLHLEIAETLELELNYKYAGMNPIALGEEIQLPTTTDKEAAPKEEIITGKVRSAATKQEKPKAQQETAPKEEKPLENAPATDSPKVEEAPPQLPEGSVTVEVVIDRTPDEVKPTKADVPQRPTPKLPEKPQPEVKKEQKAPLKPVNPDKKPLHKPEKVFTPTKKKNPAPFILLAIAAVVMVIVTGWYISTTMQQKPAAEVSQKVQPKAPEAVKEKAPSPELKLEPTKTVVAEPQKKQDQAVKAAVVADLTASSSHWGLYGTTNTEDRYFTIVVHSLGSMAKAKEIADGYSSKGYRMVLSEAEVNDKVYIRVGFGQFPTIAQAQDAIKDLPTEFQGDGKSFIRRIQH